MNGIFKQLSLIVAFLLCFVPLLAYAHIWILVDTKSAKLSVMNHDNAIHIIEDISIGRAGVTELTLLGDDKTPLGEFKVTRINRNSRFHLFFEINYPTPKHAKMAFEQGIIDEPTLALIERSHKKYGSAPSSTPLGGHLGIHGIGGGSMQMHEQFNWTNGCVAVTNKQIRTLSHWIKLGTRVIIQ